MDRKLGGLAALLFAVNANAAEGWSANEKVDAMTDARTCSVSSLGGYEAPSLMAFVDKSGLSFTAGGSAYPRTHAGIRVDDQKAFRIREDHAIRGAEAAALHAQIRAGNSITTRYYAWPSHQERVGVGQVGNLPALIASCQKFVKGN